MYLEQKIEALTAQIEGVKRDHQALAKAQLALQSQIEETRERLLASTGMSPANLAALLEEIAKNLYPVSYSSAPKGGTQDDGPPTNKPGLGAAQNAETVTPAPSSSGGTTTRAPEVVAPAEEPPPPVDVAPVKQAQWVAPRVVVHGRTVSGPRCDIFVQSQHAGIVTALLTGPKTIDELSDAIHEKNKRMTVMRLATMKPLLKDAGLEVVVLHGKHALREIAA